MSFSRTTTGKNRIQKIREKSEYQNFVILGQISWMDTKGLFFYETRQKIFSLLGGKIVFELGRWGSAGL